MLGKLSQLKWTTSSGNHRDFAFVVIILVFGIILVAKLAPYYRTQEESIAYNKVQTIPSLPKGLLERITAPLTTTSSSTKGRSGESRKLPSRSDSSHPSLLERLLFDGQWVLLKVRALNEYSSNDTAQPIEAQVISPAGPSSDIDFTPAAGAKMIGTGSPNLSTKRLYINFNEMVSADGHSYSVQGQAVGSESLATGIEGDYSSGLGSRILGVALDRTIMAADQIGTAYLFSAVGPTGVAGQEFRTAAMQTNQQASANISAETTKGLRETPAEIRLPAGSTFYVRIRATQTGSRP